MKTYAFPILISLCGLLLIGNSGCFRAIGENFTEGVTSELDSTYLSNSSSTIVKAALAELLSDSTQQALRRQLDSLLLMTGDTLDQLSQRLTANLLGTYTEEWIDARTDQLIGKLDSTLILFKGRILDEQLEEYLQHLSRDILSVELQQLTNDLLDNLTGDRMEQRLGQFRPVLSQELDSVIQAAMLTLAINANQHLLPLLDSLSLSGTGVLQQAEDTSKDIIRYLIIGLVILGVIILLLWYFLVRNQRQLEEKQHALVEETQQKERFQDMTKVIAKNIDGISSQKSYDELTRSIQQDMETKGLETDFREEILEKIRLLEQPEWKNKDAQILQLIKNMLKEESDNVPASDLRSLGPRRAEPEFTTKLRDRAREVGLEDHLDSLLNR
ncbi:MAG: hypothetical protein KTR30_14565 [Saprospiraceae bacterium]|nr:hypothetical protein [Saprospiraceae bacterium]